MKLLFILLCLVTALQAVEQRYPVHRQVIDVTQPPQTARGGSGKNEEQATAAHCLRLMGPPGARFPNPDWLIHGGPQAALPSDVEEGQAPPR
ncbi:MAG: hypothetical protein HS117_09925 [Verrucomicrobiaceae bacterium]|nr:hypothetical protein [Verrucomicrobiaceae bacterium]